MTPVFPEQRLSVLTIGVKDRNALTRFYVEVLGFHLMPTPGVSFFNLSGVVLGLWEADKLARDSGQPLTPSQEGFKGFALAYNARSEAEVDAIFARLAAHPEAQITMTPHKAFWGGYMGYFADPEGNAWEVAYNPLWPMGADGRLFPPSQERTQGEHNLALAQRQLDAYNAQDIEAHCACFAPDVVVANIGEEPNLMGIAAYRSRYEGLFAQYKFNRAEVLTRTAIGDKVVDHERVWRSPEAEPFEVLAIYTFRDGLIARVDFVR